MDRVKRHELRYGSTNPYAQWKKDNGYDKMEDSKPEPVKETKSDPIEPVESKPKKIKK